MKKIVVFALFLLITLLCSGCGDSSGTGDKNINPKADIIKNTIRYDTAYNAKIHISIKMGDSLKSVEKKIKGLTYERKDRYDGYGYGYTFSEDDGIILPSGLIIMTLWVVLI